MTTLVERLRIPSSPGMPDLLMRQAADEIESLQAKLAEARGKYLEEAALVADKEFQRSEKSRARARKRDDNAGLLKAAGYQGEPEFELVEAEAHCDMASSIAFSIRALKEDWT